ncbi:MAG: hypothetical protein AB1592_12870 [Pseudomonadota bacterium]
MKPWLRKALKIVGTTWLAIAILFIAANYGMIWYFQGFGRLTEIASPFNIINTATVLLTLAPGVLLLMWADKRA